MAGLGKLFKCAMRLYCLVVFGLLIANGIRGFLWFKSTDTFGLGLFQKINLTLYNSLAPLLYVSTYRMFRMTSDFQTVIQDGKMDISQDIPPLGFILRRRIKTIMFLVVGLQLIPLLGLTIVFLIFLIPDQNNLVKQEDFFYPMKADNPYLMLYILPLVVAFIYASGAWTMFVCSLAMHVFVICQRLSLQFHRLESYQNALNHDKPTNIFCIGTERLYYECLLKGTNMIDGIISLPVGVITSFFLATNTLIIYNFVYGQADFVQRFMDVANVVGTIGPFVFILIASLALNHFVCIILIWHHLNCCIYCLIGTCRMELQHKD